MGKPTWIPTCVPTLNPFSVQPCPTEGVWHVSRVCHVVCVLLCGVSRVSCVMCVEGATQFSSLTTRTILPRQLEFSELEFTATAGTRLALQIVAVKDTVNVISFPNDNTWMPCHLISCQTLCVPGLGNLCACCVYRIEPLLSGEQSLPW